MDTVSMVLTLAGLDGGGGASGTKQISITENGTTTHNVAAYASAEIEVDVPNSYSAGDEGKVVSNGALTAQSSGTATQNGTVDTTLINSLTVAVDSGTDLSTLEVYVADFATDTPTITSGALNTLTRYIVGR